MRYDFLIFYNFNKNLDCNVGKLIINSQSIIFLMKQVPMSQVWDIPS